LIEAIGRYCEDPKKHMGDKKLFLAVIGGDPEESPEKISAEMARVQTLPAKYGINDVVTFLGKRDQNTLPYYYSAAEAVVVPSHYESFGMVALEAMACGAPVVASQVGGLAFLVQDGVTGFTIPSGDPEALCGRLKALIDDQDLRRKMGEAAIIFAQQYAWENITERMIKVYKTAIADKGS
jgi:D-inositol-3-phosphate glycosyltransferase